MLFKYSLIVSISNYDRLLLQLALKAETVCDCCVAELLRLTQATARWAQVIYQLKTCVDVHTENWIEESTLKNQNIKQSCLWHWHQSNLSNSQRRGAHCLWKTTYINIYDDTDVLLVSVT